MNKGKIITAKDDVRMERNVAKKLNAMAESERESRDFDRIFNEFLRARFEIVNNAVAGYIENAYLTFGAAFEAYRNLVESPDMCKIAEYNESYEEGAFDDILQYGYKHRGLSWTESLRSLRSMIVSQVGETGQSEKLDGNVLTDTEAAGPKYEEHREKNTGFKKKQDDAQFIELSDDDRGDTPPDNCEVSKIYDDLLSMSIEEYVNKQEQHRPLLDADDKIEAKMNLYDDMVPIVKNRGYDTSFYAIDNSNNVGHKQDQKEVWNNSARHINW